MFPHWPDGLSRSSELQACDMTARAAHACSLAARLHEGLAAIDHIRVFGAESALPIASIAIQGFSPTDAAAILDAEYGIETRAGMHCAALIHEFLGSAAEGTLRISAGHTTRVEEVDAALESLEAIVAALHPR